MPPPNELRSPAIRVDGEARKADWLAGSIKANDTGAHQVEQDRRSPRRQRLALYLHLCRPRPVLEALLAVADSGDLDEVLADFGRIPPHIYRAVGADFLRLDDHLFTVPINLTGK